MDSFDMSLMAAVMIVIIIVMRKFLINKIPHQIWTILWFLVIVRMYVPYKIETKFNFYNGVYHIRRMLAENDLLKIGYQVFSSLNSVNNADYLCSQIISLTIVVVNMAYCYIAFCYILPKNSTKKRLIYNQPFSY